MQKTWISRTTIKSNGTDIGRVEVKHFPNNENQLLDFEIFPSYRNAGLGQKSLKFIIEKYKISFAYVEAENKRAIHIFEKENFVKIGRSFYNEETKAEVFCMRMKKEEKDIENDLE